MALEHGSIYVKQPQAVVIEKNGTIYVHTRSERAYTEKNDWGKE